MLFCIIFSVTSLTTNAATFLNLNSSFTKYLFIPTDATGWSNIPNAQVEYFDMTEGNTYVDYYFPLSLSMANTDNFVTEDGYYQLVGYFSLYYPLSNSANYNQQN